MVHKLFKILAPFFLIPPVAFAVTGTMPKVVHVGQSSKGGHFAVVNAGTSSGFAAGSEVCLFGPDDQLVLCTKVLIAKSRVAALRLTNRQYPKAKVELIARLSSASPDRSGDAGDDTMEIASSKYFRDGRSAEEIKKIENVLRRLEPAGPPAPSAHPGAAVTDTGAKPGPKGQQQFTLTSVAGSGPRNNGRRFRIGYAYHLLSPVVYNNLALQDQLKDGASVWRTASRQTAAPIGADLAFLIPTKGRNTVVRIFAAGAVTDKSDAKIAVNQPGHNSAGLRDHTTTTASHFFGAALGAAWPVAKGESWTVWVNPEVGALRSVVDVNAKFDAVADLASGAPTRLRSEIDVLMPEISSSIEWGFGYAGVSCGLRVGVPWISQNSPVIAFDGDGAVDAAGMTEALAHRRSTMALGSFVAGSMHF